jgi:hypothetical protein
MDPGTGGWLAVLGLMVPVIASSARAFVHQAGEWFREWYFTKGRGGGRTNSSTGRAPKRRTERGRGASRPRPRAARGRERSGGGAPRRPVVDTRRSSSVLSGDERAHASTALDFTKGEHALEVLKLSVHREELNEGKVATVGPTLETGLLVVVVATNTHRLR